MTPTTSLVFLTALFAIALLGGLAARVFVTAPLLAMGLGLGLAKTGLVPADAGAGMLGTVAEAALAIVLFADATELKVRAARRRAHWSGRMLVLGMPLACLLGLGLFALLLPGWPVWQLVLLAALLVPTDATISQHLFADARVPDRIRDTLNLESGLNDGIALPFIVFAGCAAVGFEHDVQQASWIAFAASQIGLGVGTGLATGVAGGFVVARMGRLASVSVPATQIATLLLVPLAYLAAKALGGNAFVAIFVAGIGFGAMARGTVDAAGDGTQGALGFVETNGALMTLLAFVYIGAVLLPDAIAAATPMLLGGVLASLLVVRPLAIWLSLLGTGASLRTRLVLGWFGPRGLATALFAVFALTQFSMIGHREEILAITTLAVAVSAVLHGLSAFAAPWLSGREETAS